MMKKLFILLLVFVVSLSYGQQKFDLNDPIPTDPKISVGFMENGMKYYVRANSTPQNRADLFLVVKAGSIDEDDDQLGLAHFCEHMAFNGTKNFPKNELVSYLESLGMEFGPEINAYTSFDETVYMIKVPLDSAEFVDKGLQVLYDWACQITDSDEEIEKERGVIHEEWRGGRGANERMMQKWLPVFLHNSRYAERLPIGKIGIIDSCSTDVLRRYRKDWYRPDLQAVIIVGDFDQEQMVAKVKELFSKIPVQENPREKKYFDIPGHEETLVSIATDKEARYPVAQIFYKHPLKKSKTIGDYRETILESLYNSMINNRLSELTQKENPPFIYAASSYEELFGPKSVYYSIAVTQNGKMIEGISAVLIENERVKKYGFTRSELDRQKAALLTMIEKAYNERDKQKSINYANEYKRNFLLTEEPIPGIENEYEYFNAFMPTITLDEVNELAKRWITDENRVVIVTAPEIEGVSVPNEEEIRACLDSVTNVSIEPYDDKVSDQPLIAEEPKAGTISGVKELKEIDAEEWTLSNGAKVVIKVTDFKDDEILFSAYSPGGSSLYGQDDDISAQLASSIMNLSGVADFDKVTLDKMLADKSFKLSPFIDDLLEGFNGNSTVKDVESLLQVLYLYFTDQRIDEGAFNSYITRLSGTLENKSASPEAAFKDTVLVVSANYSPRKRPMSVDVLKEANIDRIEKINQERFNDGSDFTFFFVGNIDKEAFKSLVEKYIASIPSINKNEMWKDLDIESPEGVVEKTVFKGQEPKSMQYIVFHGDFDYDLKNRILIDAVGKILTTRLIEVIREDKSSVYYIWAYPSTDKYPDPEYNMIIRYGLDPEKVELVKEEVFAEIKDIVENGPKPIDLEKAKEKLLREREVNLRENGYWMKVLSNGYNNGDGDFSKFGEFNDIVNSLTAEDIMNAAKTYFDFNNYFSVVLKPESAKE